MAKQKSSPQATSVAAVASEMAVAPAAVHVAGEMIAAVDGAAGAAAPESSPESAVVAAGSLVDSSQSPPESATEKPLTPKVTKAVDDVKVAYLACRKSMLAMAIALGRLKIICKEEGFQFLDVCASHLSEIGMEGMGQSWVSKLCATGEYLIANKVKIAGDPNAQPNYSQIFPLSRFLTNPQRAEKKKDACKSLHDQVFDVDPKKRPPAAIVAERVAEILAPEPPQGAGPQTDGSNSPDVAQQTNSQEEVRGNGPKPYKPGDIGDGAMQTLKRALNSFGTEGEMIWIANEAEGSEAAVAGVDGAIKELAVKGNDRVCWIVWLKK